MKTNYQKVVEFHEKFGCRYRTEPGWIDEDLMQLRFRLIHEELNELHKAVDDENLVEVADALTDLLYVVYGMGHVMGINLDCCFEEVHNSNMSKLGLDGKPLKRHDGKIMKSDQYRPPDLKTVLEAMRDSNRK